MRKQLTKIALSASLALAMAFTLSCSDDGDDPPTPIPVTPGGDASSSSSSLYSSSGTSSSSGASSSSIGDSSSSIGGSSSSVSGSGDSGSSSSVGFISSSDGNIASESSSSVVVVIPVSCPDVSVGTDTMTCGGETYSTVKIGEQIWMAENLKYASPGSKCGDEDGTLKDENTSTCDTYGRLYDWATAMEVCPTGWHLPDNADWDKLYRYADGDAGTDSPYSSPTAGKELKAQSGWYDCGPADSGSTYVCADTHGFSALPGGYGSSSGDFDNVGNYGYWWSASEYNSNRAYYRDMYYSNEYAYYYDGDKSNLFSVRCLQDYAY